MITLRSINFNANSRPDQLVTIRVYITDKLIISTRHRKVYSIDQVVNDLQSGAGPTNSGSWLVEISDALTDHTSEFIEDLHDKIIDLEDALLEQQVPERGQLALIRKQLIVLRRYMAPQRDVFARLASDRLPWMSDDDRRRMQDIADRRGGIGRSGRQHRTHRHLVRRNYHGDGRRDEPPHLHHVIISNGILTYHLPDRAVWGQPRRHSGQQCTVWFRHLLPDAAGPGGRRRPVAEAQPLAVGKMTKTRLTLSNINI